MNPRDIVSRFDRYLAKRELKLEAIVIGGAALGLMGTISRPTRDCDILHPGLSDEIRLAAEAFASAVRDDGDALDAEWLNAGPSSLTDALPAGWLDRVVEIYRGEAIVFSTLGRIELLMSKLFALCDRSTDLQDCIALGCTDEELQQITPWLHVQDGNPGWPAHVDEVLADLRGRIKHGV